MNQQIPEPAGLRLIRIFIGSPADVQPERTAALRVLKRLEVHFRGRCQVQPVFWEHLTYEATSSFQQQIPRPSECDVVVFVLWTSLGTAKITVDGREYPSGTQFEFADATEVQDGKRPVVLVYRKEEPPTLNLEAVSHQEILDSYQRIQALKDFFRTRFEQAAGGMLGFNRFKSTGEFEELLDRDLRHKLEELLNDDPQSGRLAGKAGTSQPFLGLRTFGTDDQHLFFGRTRALFQAEDALRRQAAAGQPFLVIFGRSGVGKSSFVRAGLVPRILSDTNSEGGWRFALFEPSDSTASLLHGLAAALVAEDAIPDLLAMFGGVEQLAELLQKQPEAVVPAIRAVQQSRSKVGQRLLLVVDPLEEIFTRQLPEIAGQENDQNLPSGYQQQELFARALQVLCRSRLVWVVATLRSDFYDHSSSIKELRELKQGDGQFHLPPLSPTELSQCVRLPAAMAGVRFEETRQRGCLADEMINEALRHTEPLPLLSFCLEQVFERSDAAQTGVMTFEAFDQLGGVSGAINKRAEEAYGVAARRLPDGSLANARDHLFGLLVGVDRDGLRARQYTRSDSMTDPQAKVLEEELDRARLLLRDKDDQGEAVFTIAHEAMIREWTTLRTWIDEREELLRLRSTLAAEAAEWSAHPEDRDLLLIQGGRLARAEHLLTASQGLEVSTELKSYIEANLRQRDQQVSAEKHKRNRVIRLLGAALAVSLAFLAFAVYQNYEANTQRRIAAQQSNSAQINAEDSRDFVNFLLGEFKDRLDPSQQKDKQLLDQIAKRVVEHYSELDIEAEPAESLTKLTEHMQGVAKALADLSRYDDSAKVLEKAHDYLQQRLPEDQLRLAQILESIGNYSFRAGNYPRAETAFEQSLQIYQQAGQAESVQPLLVLGGIASLEKAKGRYAAGVEKLGPVIDALSGRKENQKDLARFLDLRADLSRNLGKFAESEEDSLAAIALAQQLGQTKDWLMYRAEYSVLLQKTNRITEAETNLREVIELYLKQYGNDDDLASFRYKLARICIEQKQLAEADEQIQQALTQLDVPRMSRHLRLAKCLEAAARLALAQGEGQVAIRRIKRCLEIRQEVFGSRPVLDVADALDTLAECYDLLNDSPAAQHALREADLIRKRISQLAEQ